MKKCSYCGAEYSNDAIICAIDQTPLSSSDEVTTDASVQDGDERLEPVNAAVEKPGVESGEPPDEETALCISCLYPNRPDDHFCRRCGAPVDALSGILMPEAAQSAGFIFRRAVETPSNLIVVSGVWLYFLPGFVVNTLLLLIIFDQGIGGVSGLIFFWPAIICDAICASMLYRVTRNYISLRSKHEPLD